MTTNPTMLAELAERSAVISDCKDYRYRLERAGPLRAAIDAMCNSTSERIKTPVPLREDASPEPDPTPEPETDVGALLGGVFGP